MEFYSMPNHDNFHPTYGKTSDQSMFDAGEWYER